MVGRRGGKTATLIAEAAITAIDQRLPVGWGEPKLAIAEESWRDILTELEPFIVSARRSRAPWTIEFVTGGRLDMWTLATQVVSRGYKYGLFVLNEAGVIPGLGLRFDAEIEPTLIDYGGRMCAGSTPNVIGPDFLRWFKLGQQEGSGWKSWRWSSRDNPFMAVEAIKKEESMRARGVPEWIIQQELYAIPADSDSAFFPSQLIERHKAEYARPPLAVGRITCDTDDPFERESIITRKQVERIRWVDDPYGPWKFWQWWDGHRPPQDVEGYFASCMALDFGQGVGASNTVASVANVDTREKIAEFASAGVTPDQMAPEVAMMGLWLGGRLKSAMVNFEINGPGETFAKFIMQLKYGNVHGDHRMPSEVGQDDPIRLGWRSSYAAKEHLLEDYRAALAMGRFFNPSAAALDECLGYHYDKRRRIVSEQEAMLVIAADGARAPHGDRCIADALCWRTIQNIGKAKPPEMVILPGTLAATLKRLHDERTERVRKW